MAKSDNNNKELIKLVKQRPALYNTKLSTYNNVKTHDDLWKEVAKEMQLPVKYCRQKWVNLRNSYARYLRCTRNSIQLGRKYYLADDMSFLQPYMSKRKNRTPEADSSIFFDEITGSFEEHVKDELDDDENVVFVLDDLSDNETESVNGSPKFPRLDTTDLYDVKPPVNVQSEANPSQSKMDDTLSFITKLNEDAFVDFAKSLVIDYSHLTMKRQRTFKHKVLSILNELLDEQESEMN